MIRAGVIAAAVFAFAGCSTLTDAASARTLHRGQWQAAVQPSVLLTTGSEGRESVWIPGIDLRYGVSDRLELGVRTGAVRPQVSAKLQMLEGPVAVSWRGTLGAWWLVFDHVPEAQLSTQQALLIGIPLFGRSELVLGPKLDFVAARESAQGSIGLLTTAALSVGWIWRVSPLFAVGPEVAAGVPVFYVGTGGPKGPDGVVLQGGIAVLVGGAP